MKIVGDTVEAPRLRVRLERSHEKRVHLAAHVKRCVGVSENGKLEIHVANGRDRFGDKKMVLERNDREIDPDESTELTRPLAGSVDDDLRKNFAFRCFDEPAAARALDTGHRRVA